MGRLRLVELEDLSWLPKAIRDAGTDFLRFISEAGNLYGPIVPTLKRTLITTGSDEILDLGSGAGGPVVMVWRQLVDAGCPVKVTLTDKFPNHASFAHASKRSKGKIDFIAEPVDATAVPSQLSGFRTLFTAFHHFRPKEARKILQDAVDQRRPIGVFEIGERSLRPPLLPLLVSPIGVLLLTPFIRPFRWTRLFWTYVIPFVPFFISWDGFVSALRMYSIRELQDMVKELNAQEYMWEIGRERTLLAPVTYLIGYPRQQDTIE